jgi:hypothetical protein
MQHETPFMPRSRLGVRATAASGLFLALIMSISESLEQPMAGASAHDVWAFFVAVGVNSSMFGLCWAFLAREVEPEQDRSLFVSAWFAGTLVITAVGLAGEKFISLARPFDVLGGLAQAAHLLWINAFYGGLYMAGFIGVRRALYSAAVLTRVRLARDQSMAMADEAALEALWQQLQPSTLLSSLDALRLAYRQNPASADDLLDLIVAFLRLVVRGPGSNTSTLAEELDIASRYMHLRAITSCDVGEFRVEPARHLSQLAFPARLLMPLVEQLCLAGGKPSLHAGWMEEAFVVTLKAANSGNILRPERLRQRALGVPNPHGFEVSTDLNESTDRFSWTLRIARAARATDFLTCQEAFT